MLTLAVLPILILTAVVVASPIKHQAARDFTYPTFGQAGAAAYRVTTSTLPLFNGIDVQDSWAGRVDPASTPGSGLFFWYFPSSQSGGSKILSIWLNGGPGCSSLDGATQENGAFTFAAGTTAPIVNENSWASVSDMLYIEQPAGVGFSTGSDANLTGEIPLADAFYIFLQAFYGVFPELAAKSLVISGESYAGFYIPYIAARILAATESEQAALPLKLKGIIINDGVYSSGIVGDQAPVARFSALNQATLGFSDSFVASLQSSSQSCGYETLLDAVQYPQPPGPILLPADGDSDACDLFDKFYNEAATTNPCFNIYRITDVCPTPTDPIGDGSYLSREDVQSALHVANSGAWAECSANDPFVNGEDVSAYSETIIPGLLAQIPVLLWHGQDDSILFTGGDIVTIQNMTWNGVQGFTSAPNETLTLNGVTVGTYHTERNLTFLTIDNAGHMIPQHQPAVGLAVFTSFIGTGAVGTGELTSSTGDFIPPSK